MRGVLSVAVGFLVAATLLGAVSVLGRAGPGRTQSGARRLPMGALLSGTQWQGDARREEGERGFLVMFTGVGCEACCEVIPLLKDVPPEIASILVYGVLDPASDERKAREEVASYGVTAGVQVMTAGRILDVFGVESIPTVMLADRWGMVSDVGSGSLKAKRVVQTACRTPRWDVLMWLEDTVW